jgi:cytoskeletal protein RodZ
MPDILGETIKKARESKHLSIEEVSEKTRIPKNIIKAMEEDRLNEIHSVFYARGFVRTYSRFLGCEDDKAVKEYLAGSEKKKEEPGLALKKGKDQEAVFLKYKKPVATVLLVIFGLWILGLGVSHIRKFAGSRIAKYRVYAAKRTEEKKAAKAVDRQSKEEKPLPSIAAEDKKIPGIELEIVARSNTWMRVIGDGDLLFTGTFKKGSRDTWRAKKEIKIEFGNAGGVDLKFNGKNIGSPGTKGEKKEITVTKDGIK